MVKNGAELQNHIFNGQEVNTWINNGVEVFNSHEVYTIFSNNTFSNCTQTLTKWYLDTTYHLYTQVGINQYGTQTSNACKVVLADNVKRAKRVHLVGQIYGQSAQGAWITPHFYFEDSSGTKEIANHGIGATYSALPLDLYVEVDNISEFTLKGTLDTSIAGIGQTAIIQITGIEVLNY